MWSLSYSYGSRSRGHSQHLDLHFLSQIHYEISYETCVLTNIKHMHNLPMYLPIHLFIINHGGEISCEIPFHIKLIWLAKLKIVVSFQCTEALK